MPRTRSLAWAELKVGILAVTAVVLAAVLTFLVGGQAGFFWQRYRLKTGFQDVRGLKPGAVVRLAGVEVGTVTAVELMGAQVEVTLEMTQAVQPTITTDSRASIGSLSLLGEPVIDIAPATTGQPLPDGGFLPSARNPAQLADVAASASQSLEEATRLLQTVRQGQGTVGRLFTDASLYDDLRGFVEAAETVASQLGSGQGTLGRLVKDPAAYESLKAALANLDEMTRRINAGEGSLGRLLHDDALAQSFVASGRQLNAITGKLNDGTGTLGRLINDQELYDRLNGLAGRLARVSARLEAGEGTLGQMLQDRQLYENMNGAVEELRALVSDIRKDPKKYLTMRVSIF